MCCAYLRPEELDALLANGVIVNVCYEDYAKKLALIVNKEGCTFMVHIGPYQLPHKEFIVEPFKQHDEFEKLLQKVRGGRNA